MNRLDRGDLPTGATLVRSTLGGYGVHLDGVFVGWIHENGERWNTYLRAEPPRPGRFLGAFRQADAVGRIVAAVEHSACGDVAHAQG